MASNLVVGRGGVEYVPPISLAFWRWFFVILILAPFTYQKIFSNLEALKKEWKNMRSGKPYERRKVKGKDRKRGDILPINY